MIPSPRQLPNRPPPPPALGCPIHLHQLSFLSPCLNVASTDMHFSTYFTTCGARHHTRYWNAMPFMLLLCGLCLVNLNHRFKPHYFSAKSICPPKFQFFFSGCQLDISTCVSTGTSYSKCSKLPLHNSLTALSPLQFSNCTS